MTRLTCPRCRGEIEIEEEVWRRDSGTIIRSHRCRSCGARLTSSVDWSAGYPPSGIVPRRRAAGVWFAVTIVLLAIWVALRAAPYGMRASVYRSVSGAVEGFAAPVWGVLLVLCVLLLGGLWLRLRRGPVERPLAGLAPDVHLRAEPPGSITVVIADARGGAARDFVITRRPDDETRILKGFDDLAQKSAAFEGTGAGGGSTRHPHSGSSEWQGRVYALGLEIGERILGEAPELREKLLELPGDHLLLRIQPELSRIPWELTVARPGAQFLWQLFHVSRQIRGDIETPERRPRSGGPLKLLLLANLEAGRPGRDLPDAEREASLLLDLSTDRPDLMKVVRRTPRSAEELALMVSEGYDVIHFASHTSRLEHGMGWILADGEPASPSEIGRRGGFAPSLVFSNSCGAGAGGSIEEGAPDDMARLFLTLGVPAYLGTLWELHDVGSARFAESFYRALAAGSTLAAAVTKARESLLDAHPITWANYVLYGDPAVRLVRPQGR